MPDEQQQRPPQHQDRQPGIESELEPAPRYQGEAYRAAGKLSGKVALISGGDSGIGRAVAVHFAKEGADVAIVYLDEHDDAKRTAREVEAEGRHALLIAGDVGTPAVCDDAVAKTIEAFGGLDVLVNNAAEQHVVDGLEDLSDEQLERTFRTNVFSMFYLTRAAMPHLERGASIINTTSITAFRGSDTLIDYAATKGAVLAFTRALAGNLAASGVRVNSVAPGPI